MSVCHCFLRSVAVGHASRQIGKGNQITTSIVIGKWLDDMGVSLEGLGRFNVGNRNFDIILMDVQMPELDGIETTRRIRAHEAPLGTHTPIIAMTANATADDRRQCLDAGMDGFLSKPVRSDELIAMIQRHAPHAQPVAENSANAISESVDTHELRGEGTTQRGGNLPMPAQNQRGGNLPIPAQNHDTAQSQRGANDQRGGNLEIFDIEDALQRLDGDEILLRTVVRSFLKHLPAMQEQLRDAVAGRNSDTIHRAAHSVKGALLNLSAARAVEVARLLEHCGKTKQIDATAELYETLQLELALLIPTLENYCQ